MKKLLTALAIAATACVANLAVPASALAQAANPKLEWATKVVALQQGPELDRLVEQLADGATQELLQNWGPKLEAVPAAKQQQIKDELNGELKKYFDDVSGVISAKVSKVSTDALIPAYMEKFSLEELKQIAAFFESPAVKKYQAAAPELGNIFVRQLVETTRADITARTARFDEVAAKVIGTAPASRTAPAAPAGQNQGTVKR
ncbi:MAG: DUF2059 domain-containing protein [Pseudomonadota bacterium]